MPDTTTQLLKWYSIYKRDLPWRKTRNPYLIWISEVVLQQTRIDQGIDYYHRFIKKFPDIKSLAGASEESVLKSWQGLGYYSRARNLHSAAKQIMSMHAGKFPEQYDDIRALKGIGDYTAAAIASFAFDQKYPVLDGNVFRFLSRYFGIDTAVNSSAAKKEFMPAARALMGTYPPHDFNQAIMEFGALQCKPSSPDCASCPLHSSCFAYENKAVGRLPVKKKKQVSKDRYFYYLIVRDKKDIYMQQRKHKDIWQNLFEFPLIESRKKLSDATLRSGSPWKTIFGSADPVIEKISAERKHVLSHQNLHAKFIELSLNGKKFSAPETWIRVSPASLKKYAIPRLIDRYLSEPEP